MLQQNKPVITSSVVDDTVVFRVVVEVFVVVVDVGCGDSTANTDADRAHRQITRPKLKLRILL